MRKGIDMKKILMSSICVLALSAGTAQAQSLDYGAMQELFGEPVTTSANGSPMRESDAPMNMTIISAEEIARYPAREIPDILRHYAGVSVRQNTGTDYSVGIRGYNPPGAERLLVLVNGRQVYLDYYGIVDWGLIPVEINEIRQIEIVRGPNTALFGFNASSGVVNIVTYNPLHDDVDVAEADVGVNKNGRGSFIYTFQNDDKFGARLSGGYSTIGEDTNNHNPAEANLFRDKSTTQTFNSDVVLKLNESTQARFEASLSKIKQNSMTAYYDGTKADEGSSGLKMNLTSDTDYGIIEANVYKNSADPKLTIGLGQFFFTNDVIVAQLSDTFKIGTDHTFRIAGEYRDNVTSFILPAISSLPLSETSYHIASVSGLWYWNINPKLALSTAVRFDHAQADLDGTIFTGLGNPYSNAEYNNRYDEFGYNVGLLYKLTDIDTLRFNVAKGVDMPSSFEVGFQVPGANSFYSDPNTDVSDVHDFQLGYERAISDINGSFKASVFYQQINEMQGFFPVSSTRFLSGNIGDSKAYGFDLTLDGKTDNNIRWGVNYTFTKVRDDISTTLDFEDLNSDHIINANVGYSPNEKWDMDLFASYQSNFTSDRDYNGANSVFNVDPDVVLDARVAYKPVDKLTVSLNGQALLGENEQSSYGEEVDRQVFLRAKYDF